MPEFEKLFQKLERAKDIMEQRESKLHYFMYPIIQEALGHELGGDIDRVWYSSDMVYIDYSWRCRGCSDSDSITLPKYIFTAGDPMAAAKEYRERQEKAKKEQKRRETQEKIEWLQRELQREQGGE